jgi:hypothetical protein
MAVPLRPFGDLRALSEKARSLGLAPEQLEHLSQLQREPRLEVSAGRHPLSLTTASDSLSWASTGQRSATGIVDAPTGLDFTGDLFGYKREVAEGIVQQMIDDFFKAKPPGGGTISAAGDLQVWLAKQVEWWFLSAAFDTPKTTLTQIVAAKLANASTKDLAAVTQACADVVSCKRTFDQWLDAVEPTASSLGAHKSWEAAKKALAPPAK